MWTMNLGYVFFGDYYQARKEDHYTVIDSTYEYIQLDWPIFTNFQYFLQGLAPDMICNLKDDRMCHSMAHTCDHYIPLLVDMALIL